MPRSRAALAFLLALTAGAAAYSAPQALAAEARQVLEWAAASQGQPGTLRDASGNRLGSVEAQPPGTLVIRDADGNRVGSLERLGAGWVLHDRNGNRVGSLEGR